ncbi:MAG: YifB family Mg chelatase-like AAA ATPase [Proteobacteria bacterium]|nr:YifB family Mg chelatase-like AAA ATPase [Pseudomonadota bacterium]
MACTAHTATVIGVEAHAVAVEVDLVRRLPKTTVVGLAAMSVKEATERVRSALIASGFEYPKHRVTINLAPADIRKEGTAFDLPIAVAILAASGQIPADSLGSYLLAGELGLDGRLRTVRGALPLAMRARVDGMSGVVLPAGCAAEATVVPDVDAWSAETLQEVVEFLRGERRLPRAVRRAVEVVESLPDMSDVRGQALARRALEVAAAGGHSLLMMGAPGVGKTMLACRIGSILPPLSFEEALDASRVHSVAGLLPKGHDVLTERPFRAPHHSISTAGLLGGASLRPAELSLAHNGVLFLDELPEFSRQVLELLRGPLESGVVVLSRASGTVRLPARVTLLAAANPCPCGYLGHPTRPCRCSDAQVQRYRARLSGPLLDRIDLHVGVEPLDGDALYDRPVGESSAAIRERVLAARRMQGARYGEGAVRCNADLAGPLVREAANSTPAAERMLRDATDQLGLSGRGHDRVLRVARTLADLDGHGRVDVAHVAEAVAFRAATDGEHR